MPRCSGGFSGQAGFGDIFDSVFGDIWGGRVALEPIEEATSYNLELSLEEAVFGAEVKIRVPTLVEVLFVTELARDREASGDL